MPKKSLEEQSYFNPQFRRKFVDKFVALYLNNSIKVKIGVWDNVQKEFSSWKVDERFANLHSLVYQYADVNPVPESVKKEVEQQLYSLIMILKHEGRILNGELLELDPIRDQVLEDTRKKVERIEKSLDELKTTLDELLKQNDANKKLVNKMQRSFSLLEQRVDELEQKRKARKKL
jgi:uncharacterized protein (UPF0305 family)